MCVCVCVCVCVYVNVCVRECVGVGVCHISHLTNNTANSLEVVASEMRCSFDEAPPPDPALSSSSARAVKWSPITEQNSCRNFCISGFSLAAAITFWGFD